MSIHDHRKQTLNKIVDILEGEYNITIKDHDRNQIMHLLNQLHGQSHRIGLEEGIRVAKRFQGLQKGHS